MTDFYQFLDKVELIYYDNDFNNQNHDKIHDDLIENEIASDLCRGVIGKEYIEDVFEEQDIMGYVVIIKGEYAGFILFKKKYDFLYLSLVATTSDKEIKKGIPLGQLLIFLMEQVAIKSGIETIVADAVIEALDFYKKNGWNIVYENEDKMYFIQKSLSQDDEDIVEVTVIDEETDYDSEGDFIMKY